MVIVDDSVNLSRGAATHGRSVPHFYVVDGTATIHFASKPAAQAPPTDVLTLMLRAAVAANQAGAQSSPLEIAGRLVRSERLATPSGDERFVVFLERARPTLRAFGVTVAGDVDLSAERD